MILKSSPALSRGRNALLRKGLGFCSEQVRKGLIWFTQISPRFKGLVGRVVDEPDNLSDQGELDVADDDEEDEEEDGEEDGIEIGMNQQRNGLDIFLIVEDHVSKFVFPKEISHSYFEGRNGSNACSIITLILAHDFLSKEVEIQENTNDHLAAGWIKEICRSIRLGNAIYDMYQGSSSLQCRYLSVNEASDLVFDWAPVQVDWIVQENLITKSRKYLTFMDMLRSPSFVKAKRLCSQSVKIG